MTSWAVEDLVLATPPAPRRSWGVVLGASLSLVLHGFLLLFLMLPAESGPRPEPPARPTTEVTWFDYSPETPTPSPAQKPNRVARKPQHVATTTPQADPIDSIVVPDAVLPEPADTARLVAKTEQSVEADTPDNGDPPVATPNGASAEAAYVWDVLGHLQPFQVYPRAAQRRGHEGTVLIRARVSRRGVVLKAEIRRSSGHRSLDQAALDLLRKASPLPPPPRGATAITELDLPIAYALRQP